MHFCFLDHLHLSIGLKVVSPFQLSPCFSLNLQNRPWFSSFPSPSWRLCLPLFCLPCSSAAGVMRRPCSPPATFCSPRPRVTLLLLTALALCCWRPTRAPRFFPGCQHYTPECRPPPHFLHRLALSFPLFYSVGSAT
jgi:hypothetical protein